MFTLLGFSDYPDLQVPHFLIHFTIYSVTVLGNLGMIAIIKINPTAHPHVLFPQQPLLCGLLLFLHHCPQDHGESHGRRRNHLICRLCNAILFLLYLCGDWVLFISCDGLWPLHGHLQPSALHRIHVPETLCHISSWISYLDSSCSLLSHVLLSNYHFKVPTQSITSVSSPPCFPSLALILMSTNCCFLSSPPLMR